MLAQQTSILEVCWIKAHIGHSGNERADQLARKATNNASIWINTPPSWAAYKQALKQHMYQEWEQRWWNDNAHRMTKKLYPEPSSNKAKTILKLKRKEI